jgi:mono/diheme cytochrome c family protein
MKIALSVTIALAVPLLVYAYITEQPQVTEIQHSFPDAWVDVDAGIEQLEQPVMTVKEVLEEGKQGYQRSCVGCHGLMKPDHLPYHDSQRFIEIVRNGDNTMPALGFKLNAVEVEMIRIYLQHCADDPEVC